MTIPPDLDRLPAQALAVLRYLATQTNGTATMDAIIAGTGLSAIGAGRGMRRLVTQRLATMPQPNQYALTPAGQEVARSLPASSSHASGAAQPALTREARHHVRRLSAFTPCELSTTTPSLLRVGFDPPDRDQPALPAPRTVLLRLRADGCEVSPQEWRVEIPPQGIGGPVRFRVTPHTPGRQRFRLEVMEIGAVSVGRPLGGMYFDLNVTEFPTPACAEFQALGASVPLPLDAEDAGDDHRDQE